jgi:acetyltransferase-like isoleucine patch superfamily enzyme
MSLINGIKKRITYNFFLSALNSLYRNYFQTRRSKFGFIDRTARVRFPILIKGFENVYLYENTHILGYSKIITTKAKFIMKKNSGSAEGLTIVTGSHPTIIGELFISGAARDEQIAKDVVVEEDVWLGSNVTLLAGVIIGRGAIVGSGSVCRKAVPPYSIVTGNPSKVVGFKLSPKEIIEHEKKLYEHDERFSIELLENNYEKHFIHRLKEIKNLIN